MNANEVIEIVYQPSVTVDKIDEVFQSKKISDIMSHQTNYGPQRDELIFMINDKNAAKYAHSRMALPEKHIAVPPRLDIGRNARAWNSSEYGSAKPRIREGKAGV